MTKEIIHWHEGLSCCNERWEEAYRRFETPEEERQKFRKRFAWLGVGELPREAAIVDVFCGRGNGLVVLRELGFTNLTGVDLSPELLASCPDAVTRIVADCRDMRFESSSIDAFIVQGGLHHLPEIPEDLEACLDSIHDALRPGGYFFVVEPWETPFLRAIHWAARQGWVRRILPRFDAFGTMVEEEYDTYRQWLDNAEVIRDAFAGRFEFDREQIGMGKWNLRARKPS